MTYKRHVLFVVFMIFLLAINSHQRELVTGEDSNDESSETNAKWDAIFKDSELNDFFEEHHNLNVLNSLGKEPLEKIVRNSLKISDSEKKHLSDDEVFAHEQINDNTNPDTKHTKKDALDMQIKLGSIFNSNSVLTEKIEFPQKDHKVISEDSNVPNNSENMEPKPQTESNLKFDNFLASTDTLDTRSFIFNPNAKPQEKFQNCTTPKNETGTCRYLQHCLIPTIISSLNQFMGYVCIIEEQFIGVCCPDLPVSVVTIQEEKEFTKLETNHNKECGVGTNRRIVGGSSADPKAWPWMVALLSKLGGHLYCGGVLINDRYVLTAAHCTFGIFMNEIIARLGEYDFKNDGEPHIEYAVTEIKRHGHYNRRSLRNDVALLKLEKPVVFNDFIETICLPEEERTYVGEEAILVGWGNIAGIGSATSDVLQQATLSVISNTDCSKGHGLPILPFLICTSSESEDKGACYGDSGGPLMLLDNSNRWKVIGLVSWGRRGCNPEFPTVYTRVSHYLEWIKKHST